jgi:hypothetical protein
MLRIGQEVIINEEKLESTLYKLSCAYYINKPLKILQISFLYIKYFYLLSEIGLYFSEEELIPTLPLKIKGIIDEIKNEI